MTHRFNPVPLAAQRAAENGFSVVAVRMDGTKAAAEEWKQWQRRRRTGQEVSAVITRSVTGYALVTGAVSDNAECLDFDTREVFGRWRDRIIQAGGRRLLERVESGYSESTPSGFHLLYRAPVVAGNLKLALRQERGKTKSLIETRGEGGFFIAAPSWGAVHPSGAAYRCLTGDISTVATITQGERQLLHDIARSLDEVPKVERFTRKPTKPYTGTQERPGDYFNRTRQWEDILPPHGWSLVYWHRGEGRWRRPDKQDKGISAVTGHTSNDTLKVFSSSTPFDTVGTYSKFAAFVLLDHGGDFSAAVKAIAEEMRAVA